MTRGKDPPSKAARLYAAARATLDDGGPSFGVRVVKRGELSGLQRTRAAYQDPSAYPLPNPRNWLSQLSDVDPRTLPKAARNMLSSVISGAVQDPVSAMLPVPKLGQIAKAAKAAKATRTAKLARYQASRVAEISMKDINKSLGQRRSPFAVAHDPAPTRTTPIRQYATEREGRQVRVVGEKLSPPERITLAQARAAGVTGPAPYAAPVDKAGAPYRFTRTGPRSAEVTGRAPRTLEKAAGGDNVGIRLKIPKAVHSELGLDDDVLRGQAYPSLKIDTKGNASVSAADLKTMVDDAATRANPGQGFETPAHRRNALSKWAAANKPVAGSASKFSPKALEQIEYAKKHGAYTPRPDLLQKIKELDARSAPDSDYRSLLSSGSKEKGGYKNWREKALVFGGYEP